MLTVLVAVLVLLAGWFGMAPVPANLIAISATAVLNFALADRWVFAREP